MAAQFKLGDRVRHRAFTDCFGKYHPEVCGLTVAESNFVGHADGDHAGYVDALHTLKAYYRIKAVGDKGAGYCEAAERFFDAE